MRITRSIDIEETVRQVLSDYFTAYVRPLPKDFDTPCLLVQQVGGTEARQIDTFAVTLDARSESSAEAMELLNDAIGVLKQSGIGYVSVNAAASWGADPVRPDLALCTARLNIAAHKTTKNIQRR